MIYQRTRMPLLSVQGLELHQGLKSQGELKRFGHRFFETEFGDKAKVAEANNAAQVRPCGVCGGESVVVCGER